MKKRYKFLFIFIFVLSMPVAGLVYFMFASEAPIIKGDIDYNIYYNKDLRLDIYYPTNKVYEKSPVLIFIHGGAWIGGRKETLNNGRFNKVFNNLREQGYTIISQEYTLAEEAKPPFPGCIINGFEVIDWVYQNAGKYNFDLNNIGMMGESAGAHIVLMNSFTKPSDFNRPELVYIKPNYLIDVYGPANLWEIYKTPVVDSLKKYVDYLPDNLRPVFDIPEKLFGFKPEEDTLRAKSFADLYSPVNYINADISPVLIIHGKEDQVVPVEQSLELESMLKNEGVDISSYYFDGVNHGLINISKKEKDFMQEKIAEFILSGYKKEPFN